MGEALAAIAGGRWRLSYELRDELSAAGGSESHADSEEDWVGRFMEEFDAEEIVERRRPGGETPGTAETVTSNEKGA